MLQYKIPQDVEIEDKILGPLTLKQLLIVAGGGGISYGLFLMMSEYYYLGLFDYFWIGLPLIISLAFAFLRINDVSFLKWLMLLYEYGHNSRRRKWDKTETARLHFAFVSAKTGNTAKEEKKKAAKQEVPGKKKFSSLEELTYMLDHSANMIEAKEAPDDHEEDFALHLPASEKERQESRLVQNFEDHSKKGLTEIIVPPPRESTTTNVKVELEPEKPLRTSENITAPTQVIAPKPEQNTPSEEMKTPEKAVDMVHTANSTGEHKITFEDLMKGGHISFS